MKHARPEQALQQQVMRWLELVGVTRKALVFHIPNGGKRAKIEAKIMKSMGIRSGAADLVFIWRLDHQPFPRLGFIELKAPGNKTGLSDNQELFRADCEHLGVPYEVCTSVEEVELVLQSWCVPRTAHVSTATPLTGGSYVTGVRKRTARRRRATALVQG